MRCFVAIELPAHLRARIAALQASIPAGVRRTPPENLHLTLRFLGEVEPGDALDAALIAVARRPRFDVVLDHVGTFPRVVWLGPSAPEPSLEALARDLDAAVRGLGLPPDPKPFVAHVTIARPRGPAQFTAPAFRAVLPVDAITLFRSSAGRYSPLLRVPLDTHVPSDDTGPRPIRRE